jgi:DNA-binding SARP family transcriptional activator/predicted esterase
MLPAPEPVADTAPTPNLIRHHARCYDEIQLSSGTPLILGRVSVQAREALMYRLTLFGGLKLEGPDSPLTGRIAQRRQLALLALLAGTRDRPLPRELAVGLLWPESPEHRARARLSDALYVIRQEVGEDAVRTLGDALVLDPEVVWSDVVAFEEASAAGRWEEAVELYRGPFLEGFHPSEERAFERWVDEERRRHADRYREGLEALARAADAAGDASAAVPWWRRRAAAEPTNSRVAVELMNALAAAGNVPGALQHARIHEVLLWEELELALPPEVRSLAEDLAAGGATAPVRIPDPGRSASGRTVGPDPAVAADGEEDGRGAGASEPQSGGGAMLPPAPPVTVSSGRGRPLLPAAMAALVILVSALGISAALGGDDEAWVRNHAIPDIEELTRAGLYESAWKVAQRAQAEAPQNRELARLLPEFTWLWPELRTDPPGARVLHRPYGEDEAAWQELGHTPQDTFRLPLGATVLRLELDGYRPVHLVPDHYLEEFPVFTLDPPDRLPDGMVRVPGWRQSIDGEKVELDDFFIARYPVTNREYMRFVEAGGYRNPEYWEHPIVVSGDTLSWPAAMERFTDRTGRPGPSSWMAGSYPEGKGDHPVAGVSWYEAAAYARFAGESLPSVHHWRRAYGSYFFAEHMIPLSNLLSDGTTPVGTSRALGPFGTFDMAGNVREWTYNERGEERYILGAGWDDPDKLAIGTSYSRPVFDRSPANGIRLVRYLEDGPELEQGLAPVAPRPTPDFLAEAAPPSNEEFEIYRRFFSYDPAPLEPRLEAADTARRWVRQTISFNAAYGGERVLLHLYLPRNGAPPYQTVVYWPGDGAGTFTSIDQKTEQHTGFITQGGRALAFPVLKGTLERLPAEEGWTATGPAHERTRIIQRVQDFIRSLDYLETRDDIDAARFAYFGWSWGGQMSPVVLALDPRLQAAVLHVAGLSSRRLLPEVDPLNYLSRVNTPLLMINGRLDGVFPEDTHARPFFELLGTAPEHKRLVITASGHFVPRPILIRETLDWLDRYLGPVGGR